MTTGSANDATPYWWIFRMGYGANYRVRLMPRPDWPWSPNGPEFTTLEEAVQYASSTNYAITFDSGVWEVGTTQAPGPLGRRSPITREQIEDHYEEWTTDDARVDAIYALVKGAGL